MVTLPQPSPSRRWPLIGMLAIGLAAGVAGSFAVTRRSRIESTGKRALHVQDRARGQIGTAEVANTHSAAPHHSNRRRTVAGEVN